MLKFEIWVELDDEVDSQPDTAMEQYCNAVVVFEDGARIGVNVWSEQYFLTQNERIDWVDGNIGLLPDLIVRRFTASSIRLALTTLISEHDWLAGRGFPQV